VYSAEEGGGGARRRVLARRQKRQCSLVLLPEKIGSILSPLLFRRGKGELAARKGVAMRSHTLREEEKGAASSFRPAVQPSPPRISSLRLLPKKGQRHLMPPT